MWPQCSLRLAFGELADVLARAGRAGRGRRAAPQTPQQAAPIDLTGYWVAIVNEDWRWRMVTPPKGDYASVPTHTPEARTLADAWDPAKPTARACAYGAAGLMRMPTRLQHHLGGRRTLKIETDAGRRRGGCCSRGRRRRRRRSLQGLSVAEWERPAGWPRRGAQRLRAPAAAGTRRRSGRQRRGRPRVGGNLKVMTTNLSGGWLRRNGVPYSDAATMTEYFDRFAAPDGDEWLVVTTVVTDPRYLTQEFVTSSHFKKEAAGAKKWDPTPCKP